MHAKYVNIYAIYGQSVQAELRLLSDTQQTYVVPQTLVEMQQLIIQLCPIQCPRL